MARGVRNSAKRTQNGNHGTVTVQQVAAAAGVSVASVSRALNDRGNVSAPVRARVRAAAESLGYVPHPAARALSSRRSRTIGAVVPTLENPTFAIIVESLQKRLSAADHTLFVASSNYDPLQERKQAESLIWRGVDGIMLVGSEHDDDLIAFVRGRDIPAVNTGIVSPKSAFPCIGFDNRAAAGRLTRFLLDLGHREFAIIAGMTRANDRARTRVEGTREALSERGLVLAQERLIERPYRIVDGQIAMRALLEGEPRPTAVICGNDTLAFGAMLECQRQGVQVPGEISIAGFDDLDFASQLVPPLTTMRVPADEIGTAAADFLLAALTGDGAPLVPEIAVSLIVRGSTAPPPK